MIVKKQSTKSKQPRPSKKHGAKSDWRESLRRRLTKLPEIDGIFVAAEGNTVHVFSVIEELKSEIYKLLVKQECLVEKDHPSISFDFHTCAHQGRPPHRATPYGAEMVFTK